MDQYVSSVEFMINIVANKPNIFRTIYNSMFSFVFQLSANTKMSFVGIMPRTLISRENLQV